MRASKQRRVLSALLRPALWFCACNLLAAAAAAQCTNPTQVPNGTYTSGDHSQVDNNALSASSFAVSQGATATFAAGNCIHLAPGFRANAVGATVPTTFHAWVDIAPTPISVSPSSPPQNPPLTQSFTWTVSSPAGQSNLSHVFALFNTTSSTANACYIHYDASSNLVYLADNASTTWLGGFAPSSSGSIGNSQCSIAGTNSSPNPTSSGTQLGLTLNVTFYPASFSGNKNEYLYALDGSGVSTGWQQMGTWTVPAPPAPDFTLTTSMDSYYVQTGVLSNVSYTLTVTPQNGFNSPVSFSMSWPMYGCGSPTFNPGVLSGPPWTTTVTMQCYETLQNTYWTTVQASGGGKSHQLYLFLNVTASQQYSLTTAVSPPGSGSVTLNPPGGWYNNGTQVAVTATPSTGYQFTGFSGSLSGSSPGYVTMNSNKSVTANFAPTPITVSLNPTLTTVTPSQGLTFTAAVTGTANTAVTWELTGSGSLSAGLYTAPTSIPTFQTATVKAKSVADPTKEASVTVTLAPTAAAAVQELQTCISSGSGSCPALPAGTYCVSSDGTGTCGMQPGTYTPVTPLPWPNWDAAFLIRRSGVTVAGGTSNRSQTKLVRDRSFTKPIISVAAPTFTAPGIALKNFTVCGGMDWIRDFATQQDVYLGASAVGCPRQQTTPQFASTSCGDMLRRQTRSTESGFPEAEEWDSTGAYNLYDRLTYHNTTYTCIQSNVNRQPDINPAYWNIDFQCTDIQVQQADTGEYQAAPFPETLHYSLEVTNLALEDSAGHALSLYENGDPASPKHINDLYIHHSAINGSAVTGILHGANNVAYHTSVCDTNPNWSDDRSIFVPRNIRIENNTFSNNHTGVMGSGAVRWTGIRNNLFTNNYLHPQVGNFEGGVIGFDPCADQIQVIGNQFSAPADAGYGTVGVEMYSRNVTIEGNTISGFALEGIVLNGVFGASVSGNQIQNNNTRQYGHTGGVGVSTTESITGPCGDPRESRDIVISDNTITGQDFGVFFGAHDTHSTATLRHYANPLAAALTGSDLNDQVGRDGIVVLDSYDGPTASVVPEDYLAPRALTVRALSPVTSRCATGTQPQTFVFPASHAEGGSHVRSIQVVFSISGNDTDGKGGPDSGDGGCYFAYFPQDNMVYLAGADGTPWTAGNSLVGPGGIDLPNGHCTIHAGWTAASMPEPYISPFISHGRLVIEFPTSSKKHIYTVVQDDQVPEGRVSDGGTWKYWGWWATP